jgi:hypothetical protein
MAQGGAGADCGNDAGPFLPLGRVVHIPFSDLEQERRQDLPRRLQSFGKATETSSSLEAVAPPRVAE